MSDENTDYDGGEKFVLTHRPPDEPDPDVTFLTCDIEEAVATARRAAGDKHLEIARRRPGRAQCLQRGLVDEILWRGAGTARRRRPLHAAGASTGSTWNRSVMSSQVGSTMLRFHVHK
ncbi:hypothetical protein LV779_36335 [Streptomyces thinghirensis]|nr:hypothetical protein [Streptomyces thinghirensis]